MSTLILKSFLGLIFLMLFMGLVLFISAGSFSFWQAWVFLAVFSLCTILITAYLIRFDQNLLASRVKTVPGAETQMAQKVIAGLANVFFIGLLIVPGLDYRFHWSEVPPVVSILSDGVVALGFFIVFLVFRANTYTSGIIEVLSDQKVITTGPYSVVRHPMYAGAILLLFFSPLALGSWVGILVALSLILLVAVRLIQEEKFLLANLNGYEQYRQKVRYRLIPFIW